MRSLNHLSYAIVGGADVYYSSQRFVSVLALRIGRLLSETTLL